MKLWSLGADVSFAFDDEGLFSESTERQVLEHAAAVGEWRHLFRPLLCNEAYNDIPPLFDSVIPERHETNVRL